MADKENDKNAEGKPWWVRLVKSPWQNLKSWVTALRGDPAENVQRVAIWSVHPSVQVWYFWVFAAQTFWITVPEILGRFGWGMALTAYKETWDAVSGQLLSAAITSLIATEIGGSLVMIASRMYDARESARRKRREEGRAELDEEVQAWYKRQQESLAKGEPFDEPPPRAHQEESSG